MMVLMDQVGFVVDLVRMQDIHQNQQRKKMSDSLKLRYKSLPSKTYTYICEKCGKKFVLTYKIKNGRHVHCDECKQHRPKYKKCPTTFMMFLREQCH